MSVILRLVDRCDEGVIDILKLESSAGWAERYLSSFLGDMTQWDGTLDSEKRSANGMYCLAAQLVADIKTGVGDVYIGPVDGFNEETDVIVITEEVGGFVFKTMQEYLDGLYS